MGVIALASAKGAPGVTTTALALGWAWPTSAGRRCLVVDADVAGSGIAAGLLQAHTSETGGLLALAAERHALHADALLGASLALDASQARLVLLGVTDPAQARALTGLWPQLLAAARDLDDVDVLLDVGRLGAAHEPTALLEGADLAVLVARSSLGSVAAGRPVLRRLREVRGPGQVGVVLVGEHDPYSAGEISTALGVDVIAVLADDPAAARVLSDGGSTGSRFTRSTLMRTAGHAARQLDARTPAVTTTAGATS